MKKIVFVVLFFVTLFGLNAYALDTTLPGMRDRIFEKSQEIKPRIATSSDSVYLSSMWDTCLIMMTRIDGYFYMLGIFNSIKEDQLNGTAFDFLADWLKVTRNLNQVNLKGLDEIAGITDPKTEEFVKSLKVLFRELSGLIDTELSKISLLRQSLKIK